LSTRDIEAHLAEIYGVKVGRDLISRVTDAVMEDVREWQQRPLDDVYPVIFLDALVLKVREGGTVQRRACYLALGVTVEGEREVLGMWFQETEGAKFWMEVLSELKQRGVSDIRQRRAGVDKNAQLDDSPTRVQNPLRRPSTRVNRLHRKSDASSLPSRSVITKSDGRHFRSPRRFACCRWLSLRSVTRRVVRRSRPTPHLDSDERCQEVVLPLLFPVLLARGAEQGHYAKFGSSSAIA
jgi:transposase-like protein